MKNKSQLFGIICVVLGALCWGTSGIFVRASQVSDPWEIAFWRSASMAIFVALVLSLMRGRAWLHDIYALGWRAPVVALLIGSMFIVFILSISLTTVANVSLISCSVPMIAALFGWLFLRERLAPATCLALVVTLIGLGVIFGSALEPNDVNPDGFSAQTWLGCVLALVLNLLYATNLLVIRSTPQNLNLLPTIVLAGIFSALIALFFAWPLHTSAESVAWLSFMGVLQLGAGFMLVFMGARLLTMVQTTLLGLLEPITAPLWVWLIFAEAPSRYTLIGGALVLVTVVIHELWHLWQGPDVKV